MKLLEQTFMIDGYIYEQIERSSRCVLYKRSSTQEALYKNNTIDVVYEVAIIIIDDKGNERYPTVQEWTKFGRTITNMTRAYRVYERCERTGELISLE